MELCTIQIYSKGDRFNSEIYGTSAALIQMTKYFAVAQIKIFV